MSRNNEVCVSDVEVDYRTRHGVIAALRVDRFAVAAGSSTAVMGPSGSGKSTLLGLLAGLAIPTRGTVTVGDATISAFTEPERVQFRRSELGMVYQADNLLPHLTVEENVGLQLALSERDVQQAGSRCEQVLGRLGLADLRHRSPDQLSGGQRQRVAVARAVVHRPAVLLADEPTGALDSRSRTAVVELLLEAQRSVGATLIIVTHDPEVATRTDNVHHLDRPARRLASTDAR